MILFFAVEAESHIYYYDFSWANTVDLKIPTEAKEVWDTGHLLSSLQGVVNRAEPRLYVRFQKEYDDFWWNEFQKPGGWLENKKIVKVDNWTSLLEIFQSFIHGLVVYSELVPPTSNLASTISGIENRICLRYDTDEKSVFTKVMNTKLPFTNNIRWLIDPATGKLSTEIDSNSISPSDNPSLKYKCYLWAKNKFLDSGLCSPEFMAYYIDAYWFRSPFSASFPNSTIMNHDFFISRRAFFFDLGVWDDETPIDEPDQKLGSDREILKEILYSMYKNTGGAIFQIGGFVPWIWKYTNEGNAGGKHDAVPTEWELVKIVSGYNGVIDADALGLAGLANASFYQHYPLKRFYQQNPRPSIEDLKRENYLDSNGNIVPKVYISFYMGDFDSSAWLHQKIPQWWSDPARGEISCSWPFNPNLCRRVPHVFDYVRTNATPKDWFVYGDSGAGYLNPGMLAKSARENRVDDGFRTWISHNLYYGRRFDLTITGFIIDGYAPPMPPDGFEAYYQFSPDGIVAQKILRIGCFNNKLPFLRMGIDLHGNPETASETLLRYAREPKPSFCVIRTILKSPSWHKEVIERVKAKTDQIVFIDLYTLFQLVRIAKCQ